MKYLLHFENVVGVLWYTWPLAQRIYQNMPLSWGYPKRVQQSQPLHRTSEFDLQKTLCSKSSFHYSLLLRCLCAKKLGNVKWMLHGRIGPPWAYKKSLTSPQWKQTDFSSDAHQSSLATHLCLLRMGSYIRSSSSTLGLGEVLPFLLLPSSPRVPVTSFVPA